ncbi:5-(carboxyamino)imidazole ribonucleotide synthase [Anoxynatronum buryatiense]|uniref:N5-carboxyaminoimidazole ribonucleotide synthase n=1 Tax=Anoxynatronum buryatiense TaxID=489973 RepID=A0AA46AJ85_9CLOT|nr:5-(carboxyamino)imidazole ribonucleotide synthase [Anoxynatronum buryatiense]SMP59868.1 5-(carboxyamino)imidazole ribonucleotide synthase [Anoxynatronum buryatiense]
MLNQAEIGVVGGGQLGKMLLLEGHRAGLTFAVLDPAVDCPAGVMSHQTIQAAFTDEAALEALAAASRRLTYEFEHIDARTLMRLESSGCQVMPSPETLYMVQDKFRQKSFLASCCLPVPDFMQVKNEADAQKAGEAYGYPFMLKSCTGGYDGKGNALVETPADLNQAMTRLGGGETSLMAEKCIDFLMEISVLAARDEAGNLAIFPVGQNQHRDSILHRTLVPAPLPVKVLEEADQLARNTLKQLKGAGIFCIEMFVDREHRLTINEIAPRTHNSGHHTIESCNISQFGQQLRALMGWPLLPPRLLRPAVMINLLGDPRHVGKPRLAGIEEALALGEVHLHLYGKTESRPGRKMGHVTVLADTLEEALILADRVEALLRIEVVATASATEIKRRNKDDINHANHRRDKASTAPGGHHHGQRF